MSSPRSILKQYWHYDRFRELQEDIINCILEKKDCIALLPTGGGKSLCFQIPALILNGLTLVISPLISLMQDQVSQLKSKGIAAEYLHSGLSHDDVTSILNEAEKGQIKLLYLSPERIQNKQFKEFLPYLKIRLIAIDEAHCISQWGHDFRPDFLQIKLLKTVCQNASIIALTASATKDVLADIQDQLEISGAKIFRKSFNRENIFYKVQYSENKYQQIIQHCITNKKCSIIYCRSRRKTEEITQLLIQNGISASAYHAGINKELRSQAQEDWMSGKVMIIVATTAFGMGIDKPDVYSVVHFDAPEHLEAYYQETGRAGRAGAQAQALALYNFADIEKLENSTQLHFPPEGYLRKVYQFVCDFLQIPVGVELEQYFDFDLIHFLNAFKLESVPATHALRLLSQEGLWTLSEAIFRPATVQFIASRNVIDEINTRYPDLALVSTGLLRIFSGIYHSPQTLHLIQFARYLKLKKEDIQIALQKLDSMGIIEYQVAKESPQLYFHHYRVPSKDLILNHKRIKRLRDNHQKRTDAMISFLNNTEECLNKTLLNYFDEEAPNRCNHCANCKEQNNWSIKPKQLREQITVIIKAHGSLSLNELLHLTGASNSVTTQLIRTMIDERTLCINDDGNICLLSD